jgi:hypothetical protein
MAACVDKRVQLAIAIARNEDRLSSHVQRQVIVFVWDLCFVGEKDPVPFPDVLDLKLE